MREPYSSDVLVAKRINSVYGGPSLEVVSWTIHTRPSESHHRRSESLTCMAYRSTIDKRPSPARMRINSVSVSVHAEPSGASAKGLAAVRSGTSKAQHSVLGIRHMMQSGPNALVYLLQKACRNQSPFLRSSKTSQPRCVAASFPRESMAWLIGPSLSSNRMTHARPELSVRAMVVGG